MDRFLASSVSHVRDDGPPMTVRFEPLSNLAVHNHSTDVKLGTGNVLF
jgi:hypothetical protein